MKSSELRIGNLVIFDNRIFEIDTIAKEFPTLNTIEFGIGVVDWNNINPIPLTEEWLLKFGFEHSLNKASKHLFIFKSSCYFSVDLGINIDNKMDNVFYHKETLTRLDYVHQIQNLYFALTNEELSLTTTT